MDRSQFPILSQCTYLNTPSSGLLSTNLLHWRNQHDLDYFTHGSEFRVHHGAFLTTVKEALANFFHAPVKNTFLVPNFSLAFNALLGKLPSSSNFLFLEQDYPALSTPIEQSGFIFHQIPVDEYLEERILAAVKKHNPHFFVCSLVQYITGISLSIDFIQSLKKEFPALIILADGTQYMGTEVFDFESSGIDILVASGYKWMHSGYGNGFVFASDQATDSFTSMLPRRPVTASFLGDQTTMSLILEPGHQDTLAYGSLGQSIKAFHTLNYAQDAIELKHLTEQAKQAFSERGLLEERVVKRKTHSSIFNLSGDHLLFNALRAEKIICLPRGNGIRVGFHFFNTSDDLHHLLEVIDEFNRG